MDDVTMANEVAKAIHRERQMADAARRRRIERSDLVEGDRTISAAGAWNRFGRALVRAGRTLGLGTAPRPEPVAR
jgi:hypothetical protein